MVDKEVPVTLAAAIDAKDAYTRGHSQRVQIASSILGEELGVDTETADDLYWSALLHDIGKAVDIHVPDRRARAAGTEVLHVDLAADEQWRFRLGPATRIRSRRRTACSVANNSAGVLHAIEQSGELAENTVDHLKAAIKEFKAQRSAS